MVRIIVAGPIRRFGRRLRDSEFRRDPKDQYDEKQFSHDPSRVEWPVYKNRNGHKKAQETQKFLCFVPFGGYKISPGRWSERSTDELPDIASRLAACGRWNRGCVECIWRFGCVCAERACQECSEGLQRGS